MLKKRLGFFFGIVMSTVFFPKTAWAHAFAYYASTPITPPGELLWWWPFAMLLLVIGTYFPLRHSLKWSRLFSALIAFVWVALFTVVFFWFGNAAANSSTAPPPGLGFPCGAYWGRTFSQVGSIFVCWNLFGLVLFLLGPAVFLIRTGIKIDKNRRLSHWLWGVSMPIVYGLALIPFIVCGTWVHGWGGGYVTGRCRDQLADIHYALVMYALDHDLRLPTAKDYAELYPQIEPNLNDTLKNRGWRGTTDVCVIGKAWDRTPKPFVWNTELSGKEIMQGDSWELSAKDSVPFVHVMGDDINVTGKPWVNCPYIPVNDIWGSSFREAKIDSEQLKRIRKYRGFQMIILDVRTGVVTPLSEDVDFRPRLPQWSGDGKSIYYASLGKIYRSSIDTGTSVILKMPIEKERLDAFAFNRTDNVFAVDTWSKESGRRIHFLSEGSSSRQLQNEWIPSKMYGWSPDGKKLLFVGKWDKEKKESLPGIYTISIDDGEEARLSIGPEKDDNPEFTPDGKHIWFCSERSGTMQLWQMKDDGNDPQQMTQDDGHCFNPHISPDGKSVAYLSCPKESYRSKSYLEDDRISIRIMPIEGGDSKELISFRGGLDSFQMNSWSPDGTKIVFVRYTFRQ